MNVALALDMDLEPRIKDLGRKIFGALGSERPSAFTKNYWSGRIMEWSMTKPEFKVNMFRLVDVLPSLRSSAAIAEHVNEYLGDVGAAFGSLGRWGVNAPPRSLRAKATAFFVKKSVAQMAQQFIAGNSPTSSLKNLQRIRRDGLAFTVDLLGEFSVSEKEALQYVDRYTEALDAFGKAMPQWEEAKPLVAGHPGETTPICISVKLTALYSQCSILNFDRTVEVLSERLSQIVRSAKRLGALIYIDAEDCGNNPMVYATYKQVFGSSEFKDFPYPGIVLQAYAKQSGEILDDLLDFSKKRGAPIAIRLVKGAYWDHETILAEQGGYSSPLFSRKETSDAQYEHLSRMLIDNRALVLPAFGSHNIRSLAHACCYAESKGLTPKDFELQMLYGMAGPIAQSFRKQGYLVRLYVPLGEMLVGMGYLVRRLLENTSNESFLRHTFFDADAVEGLLAEPRFRG